MARNEQPQLLERGSLLRERYLIQEIVGHGGYGQIYRALDRDSNFIVAIKAEPTHRRGKRARRMILEQRVLLKLQGRAHAPLLLQSGCNGGVNFMVMQMLSANVGSFRRQSPLQRLSRPTAARVAIQAIAGLHDLHQIGFIHRDVKPSNLCFGISPTSRHRLFLIDYGLVRRFRTADGGLRPPRSIVGFRGTLRYASVSVHRRQETGPSDDLVSLFYTFVELVRGSVPWRRSIEFADILAQKEQLTADAFLSVSEGVSDSIALFGQAINRMSYADQPNYTALQQLLYELVGQKSLSDPYDWEEQYAEVLHEDDVNRALGLQARS